MPKRSASLGGLSRLRSIKILGPAAMGLDLRPNGRVNLSPTSLAVVVQQHGVGNLGQVLRVQREIPLLHEGNKSPGRALNLFRRRLHDQRSIPRLLISP